MIRIYKNIKTPLYLVVAIQELRHLSHNQTINLASTQKGVIKEYIENLTKLYHHNDEFVKRVFSYLYLTDGLSESELLEVLNTDLQIDEKFEKQVASDDNHIKEIKELPIVIWARLYSHIKEFLKYEQKDNQETMNFFHREFNDVIKNQEDLKQMHKHLIELIVHLINDKYQYMDPTDFSWIRILIDYIKLYKELNELNVENKEWNKYFINQLTNIADDLFYEDFIGGKNIYQFTLNYVLSLSKNYGNEWFYDYLNLKEDYMNYLDVSIHSIDRFILAEEKFTFLKKSTIKDSSWQPFLNKETNNMKTLYKYNGEFKFFEDIWSFSTLYEIKELIENDEEIEIYENSINGETNESIDELQQYICYDFKLFNEELLKAISKIDIECILKVMNVNIGIYFTYIEYSKHLDPSELENLISIPNILIEFIVKNDIDNIELKNIINEILNNLFDDLDNAFEKICLRYYIENNKINDISNILNLFNYDYNFLIPGFEYEISPLTLAVQKRNLDITNFLIENGAKIEVDLEPIQSVLLVAVQNNDIDMVKLLLKNNANIHIESACGETPYDYAIENELSEIIEIFIDYKEDELLF